MTRLASQSRNQSIWERAEPVQRPAPVALSREDIVRVAIALADEHGLAAVSLRKVGAALEAGPMRLYGFVSAKEELLDFMVDAVYGEIVSVKPTKKDWRGTLQSMAHRTRQAAKMHAWFAELLGGRPHLGPNALAYLEAALASLADTPGFETIDDSMQAVETVNAYVAGAIRNEAGEARAQLESGLDKTEWQSATGPYIERMIATRRFPTLARVVRNATHPPFDVRFERGLGYVFDGIAARIASNEESER